MREWRRHRPSRARIRGAARVWALRLTGLLTLLLATDRGLLVGLLRGEALERRLRELAELLCELIDVGDDPAALGPDSISLGVQVLDPLLGRRRQPGGLLA